MANKRQVPGDEPSDEALLGLVTAGDPAAFRLLIARHRPRVLAVAWRMMASQADGDDVAQEAFARVWVHAAKWKSEAEGGQAKFSTWLTRVTMNLCIDRKRRPKTEALEVAPEAEDESEGAEDGIIRRQVAAEVAEAIAALPARQKQVIVLCVYEEVSNIEAAHIMGLSIGAVESLLVRARRSLKKTLAHLGKEA